MKDRSRSTSRRISPIFMHGDAAERLLVHPSFPPTRCGADRLLKVNPDTPYATSSRTTQHLCGEMLRTPPASSDAGLLPRLQSQHPGSDCGQIKLTCDSFAVAYEQVKAGKARAFSITSPEPYPLARENPPTPRPCRLRDGAGVRWSAPQHAARHRQEATEELPRSQDPRSPRRAEKFACSRRSCRAPPMPMRSGRSVRYAR